MDNTNIKDDANELHQFRLNEEAKKLKVRSILIGAGTIIALLIAVAYSLNTVCESKVKLGTAEVKVAKQNMEVLSTALNKSKLSKNKAREKIVASAVDSINPRLNKDLNDISTVLGSPAVNQYWNIPGRMYVYWALNKYDAELGDANKDSLVSINKLASEITKK